MPSINLDKEALSNFAETIEKEWIITNGLGGYASSTVLGINTRKYHGLLVAAFHPPSDRRICLSKLDEEILVGKNIYPLSANEFQNGIFPQGHLSLREFSVSPFPKYVYVVQDIEVQKTIFMPFEKNAVITVYTISNKSGFDAKIRVFPLINYRNIHSVTDRWRNPFDFIQKQQNKEMHIRFSVPQSTLLIKTTDGQYHPEGKWVERLYYREEAARGESCIDDCYQLGYFEVEVKANKKHNFAIIAVADGNEAEALEIMAEMSLTMYDIEVLHKRETERRENFLKEFYEEHKGIKRSVWLDWIVLATDTFIVKMREDAQKSVVAGYHWFDVWGRDTFISMPGLMLVTRRFEDVRKVFLTFKKYCKQGLIPNFLPEQHGQSTYNTVDATLWFVNAVLQYLKYTDDFKFVQEQLWETLGKIIEQHLEGTDFNIRMDSDSLLSHGSQLTWMDAAVDNQPITPRGGKAVEIQALWFNALKTMELLANVFGEKDRVEKYTRIAENARKSFAEKFWNQERNCLFDVVGEYGRDDSLRPNQAIAVSLDFTMLDNARNEKIVDIVHREFLTPCGLRTLARNDSKYVGIYAGDRKSRDKAYHNGTVWPWLLGPFLTAFLKTKGYTDYRREYALKNFLMPLFTEQLYKAGLGTISEIFDGDPPHKPRGCIAQAWSVAEPFRAYVEDVMQIRPTYERKVLQNLK